MKFKTSFIIFKIPVRGFQSNSFYSIIKCQWGVLVHLVVRFVIKGGQNVSKLDMSGLKLYFDKRMYLCRRPLFRPFLKVLLHSHWIRKTHTKSPNLRIKRLGQLILGRVSPTILEPALPLPHGLTQVFLRVPT